MLVTGFNVRLLVSYRGLQRRTEAYKGVSRKLLIVLLIWASDSHPLSESDSLSPSDSHEE